MPTIEDIKTVISRRGGLAKPNRFKVDFAGLSAIRLDVDVNYSDLNFLVDNISIPGRVINTFEYAILNHSVKIPSAYDEDDVEIVFNLTNDFMPKKIIDAWAAKVINQGSYLASYATDYKCNVTISQLNENDDVVYAVILKGAYPIASKGLFLDNSAESTVSRFSCTLTYDRFENVKDERESYGRPISTNLA